MERKFNLPSYFGYHSSPGVNQHGAFHRRKIRFEIPYHSDQSPGSDRFHGDVVVDFTRYGCFATDSSNQ